MSCSSGLRFAKSPTVEARFLLSPAARALGVPTTLVGTGKHGRITKSDALLYLSSQQQQPPPLSHAMLPPPPSPISSSPTTRTSIPVTSTPSPSPPPPQRRTPSFVSSNSPFKEVPTSTMRRVIASRLSESKFAIPHAYATTEVKIDSCVLLRTQMKNVGSTLVPSVNDLVIKASALALREVPELNVYLEENKRIRSHETVDISVAVATKTGLITPIVFHADTKSLREIAQNMKDLAIRAKENKLKPVEFQGGSFTVSNLGMMGIADFTAIINPPQVAILAVGAGVVKKKATFMAVTLSFDARIVSEMHACQFLQVFQKLMENPASFST